MNDKKRQEVIENMIKISGDLQEELTKNNQEIENIGYYKDFRFKGTQLGVNEAYVVKIRDNTVPEKEVKPREKGEKEEVYFYEIYDKDNNLVATVDTQGNVQFEPEYLEGIEEGYLDSLELDDAEFELPEELGKDDLVLTREEIEEARDSKTVEDISKVTDSKVKSYSEMKTNQQLKFEQATNKQELDPNTRVTQTETLADMIPELKEKGIQKVGVVYSDPGKGQNGRFSFVGLDKDGKLQTIESLENIEGTTTGQKITSINSSDGSKVEEEQVAGMVRINNRSKTNGQEEFLSVKVGNYGILEVDYVRGDMSRDKDERYFSAPIETKNIRPTTREVRETMDKYKNSEIDTEIERTEENIEEKGKTELRNVDDVAYNDYINEDTVLVFENGKEATAGEIATRLKISTKEFINMYNNEIGGKTVDEKVGNIEEEVNEQYMGGSGLEHEHKH